jgi:hypothetical protein
MVVKKRQHWIWAVLQWAGPLVLSAFVAYGSVQFAQGTNAQRLATVERDLAKAKDEHSNFISRDEFGLMRDDLKEIKADLRELRRFLTRGAEK